MKQPRVSARQTHRDNVPASSAEEYFRITLYNEFVSHLIEELEERFTRLSTPINTVGLLQLLPSQCTSAIRLSGLSLIKMNRDICDKLNSPSKMKALVQQFYQLHPRRMKLPFMLVD